MKKREQKSFQIEVKDVSETGEFVGIASVYGNVDQGNDRVCKGAFTKTLAERGADVPILWQHNQSNPIGLGTLTDSDEGLLIKGKLDLDIVEGQRAYSGLKKGYLKGLSIGYDVVKKEYDAKGVRNLKELKLYEVSTVTFPMNEEATVTRVKALQAIDVKSLDLPDEVEYAIAHAIKSASLSDRLSGAYAAVRAKYPLTNAYPMSDEIYDDYLIVCTSYDGDYYRIAITGWDDETGVPTLGEAIEVVRTYVPASEDAVEESDGETASDSIGESKAGRVISAANANKIKSAHEHVTKALEHLSAVMDASTSKKSVGTSEKEAAVTPEPANELSELASLLRASIDAMRGSR